jgi:hypothetical protein
MSRLELISLTCILSLDCLHIGGRLRRLSGGTHVGAFARAQNGWTALIMAAQWRRADSARVLLDAGADKNAVDKVRASSGAGVMLLM